jgi:hypothetical protein
MISYNAVIARAEPPEQGKSRAAAQLKYKKGVQAALIRMLRPASRF